MSDNIIQLPGKSAGNTLNAIQARLTTLEFALQQIAQNLNALSHAFNGNAYLCNEAFKKLGVELEALAKELNDKAEKESTPAA
jgi:primosomal protein N''